MTREEPFVCRCGKLVVEVVLFDNSDQPYIGLTEVDYHTYSKPHRCQGDY